MKAFHHIAKLLLAALVFHLAACSFQPTSERPHSHSPVRKTHILDKFQTHKLVQLWKANQFKSLPSIDNHTVSFTNKHKLAKNIHTITSGYDVSTFSTRSKGIGLPVLIQTKKTVFTQISEQSYLSNIHPGTLVATVITDKTGSHIQLTLIDPRDSATYVDQKLSIQDNIVIDKLTSLPGNSSLRFLGLIKPHKYKKLQGFYLSRPYDKNRIPIVMVHGILSTPESFMDMAEAIELQQDLNKKYQIWHYFYPTGIPWLATAHDFRTSFRQLVKTVDPQNSHPNIDKTVIIAHSMGGLISRLSVSEPKDTLAQSYLGEVDPNKYFNKPQIQQLNQYFYYKPLKEPKKVVLLAVPHQGSRLANGFLAWTANKIIAVPTKILKGAAKTLKIKPDPKNKHLAATLKLITEENAVDQLQPKNPAIKALNNMELSKSIQFHSIIGEIAPFKIRACSDGVVSYCSSHLKDASSETIVRSSHDIGDSPEAINQVIKILRSK